MGRVTVRDGIESMISNPLKRSSKKFSRGTSATLWCGRRREVRVDAADVEDCISAVGMLQAFDKLLRAESIGMKVTGMVLVLSRRRSLGVARRGNRCTSMMPVAVRLAVTVCSAAASGRGFPGLGCQWAVGVVPLTIRSLPASGSVTGSEQRPRVDP